MGDATAGSGGMTRIPIAEIKIVGRHRKDMGDIGALATSIREVGLLHPPAVTSDLRLVAGHRRVEACRSLGWSEIPVTVVTDLNDAHVLLLAERDENTCREDMRPSEKVALGKALEELERPDARKRQGQRTDLKPPVNFTESPRQPVRDIVGGAVGMSGVTYHRAKTVVEASEDTTLSEDVRAVAVEAREEMDRTGKVLPAHDKVAPLVGKKAARGGKARTAANGRTRPRRIGPGAEKRRLEDFMRAYGVLIQACATAPTVDVPPLPSERRAELCSELERAARCVHQLKHKIEEAT